MRRSNKKHTRAIERHRRNKGPELLSLAADKELKNKADQLAQGLATATIEHGSAAAASLLVDLAESAAYNDNPAAIDRAFSIIDQWEVEPQVVALDTNPQIAPPPRQLQLTIGCAPADSDAIPDTEADEPEAERDAPETQLEAPRAQIKPPGTGTTPSAAFGRSPRSAASEILEGKYEFAPGAACPPPR